jgi:hypothetical protein
MSPTGYNMQGKVHCSTPIPLKGWNMTTIRLTSRFLRPDDAEVIASVQEKLKAAGLVPVQNPELVSRVQAVRRSVGSIRAADEAFNQEPVTVSL